MKILYISYFYPPLGGPAALRNLKTIHYLSAAGAEIHLITVKDIQYTYYDESLLERSRAKSITRAPSLDPMALLKRFTGKKPEHSQAIYTQSPEKLKLFIRRLFPIDDKIGWLPGLIKSADKLLARKDFDLIYVSCGPFSSALAAYTLANKYALPLVVDYRDYWTLLKDYDLIGSLLSRAFSSHWERRILKRADLIVSATQGIVDDLAAHFDPQIKDKSFVLYNGYDEADFAELPAAQPDADYFSLAYFGNIYARRSLKQLYQAILELERELCTPRNLRIKLYGNFNTEVYQEAESSGIREKIGFLPQIPHRDALFEMQKADALILIVNSSSPAGTLTSKIFEYLRLGKKILALVPLRGEAAELLTACGNEYICPMESVSAIKACLYRLFCLSDAPRPPLPKALLKYERSRQLNELFQILQNLVDSTHPRVE